MSPLLGLNKSYGITGMTIPIIEHGSTSFMLSGMKCTDCDNDKNIKSWYDGNTTYLNSSKENTYYEYYFVPQI